MKVYISFYHYQTMNLSGEWLSTSLKTVNAVLEHTELTYDLAQRTVITAKRGAKNLPLCQCIELNLIF